MKNRENGPKKSNNTTVVRLYDRTNQEFDSWGHIDNNNGNFFLGHGDSFQENLSGYKIETWGDDKVIQVSRKDRR